MEIEEYFCIDETVCKVFNKERVTGRILEINHIITKNKKTYSYYAIDFKQHGCKVFNKEELLTFTNIPRSFPFYTTCMFDVGIKLHLKFKDCCIVGEIVEINHKEFRIGLFPASLIFYTIKLGTNYIVLDQGDFITLNHFSMSYFLNLHGTYGC
jgi:hypothetical protein